MFTKPAVRVPPLANQISESLRSAIVDGTYPPGSRFPSEVKLAQDFKVSRGTIRTAIDSLEQKGLVVRKQGVGTFVTNLGRITNPLNVFTEWTEVIENNGFEPSVSFPPTALVSANQEIQEKLQILNGAEVLQIPQIFHADDAPVIYSWDWISKDKLAQDVIGLVIKDPSITMPWMPFITHVANLKVHHFVSAIWSEIAKNCELITQVSDPFEPVMVVEEVGYNAEGSPLVYSLEFFIGNLMALQVVRNTNI